MQLRTYTDPDKINVIVRNVRFVHAAYKPASMRREFPSYEVPEAEYKADFFLAEGETVESVLNYHYRGAAKLIGSGDTDG